jgi:hypothetical protein
MEPRESLEKNLNKNTKTKTKSDRYPPKDLDSIMARFFLGVLKKDGTEYEPDSLGSMYNSLDRHLYPINIRQIYDECLLF